MGNCLLTKLKSSVNNDSLSFLGAIVLRASADTSFDGTKRSIIIGVSPEVTLEIISTQGYFTDSAGTANLGRSITYHAGDVATPYYVSNHSVAVKIYSKYDLARLVLGTSLEADLSEFDYVSCNSSDGINLSIFKAVNYGNVENLNHTLLNSINLYDNPTIMGDVSQITFTQGTSGSSINMYNIGCTGDMVFPANRGGFLDISSSQIGIDFDTLANTKFVNINCANCPNVRGAAGNIINKVDKAAVTKITLGGTSCSGAIETMIEGLYGTTRTASSLQIQLASSMTLHGGPFSPVVKVEFDGSTVKLINSNTQAQVASYNGSSWTYA